MNEKRLRRRRVLFSFITKQLSWFIPFLLASGYFWIFIVPFPQLSRKTYIDENALQPGQVATYWDWQDVRISDSFLDALEILENANASSQQRAHFLKSEFIKIGISASTQKYSFSLRTGQISGNNVYGILYSPGTAGTEALIISASWLSLSGRLNLRGVSTVLALCNFLKRHSLWAKDIIFIISDGHLDGMHAWLAAYHSISQSNMQADSLELSSGIIWIALNIDYAGHSFSHLGIIFEGINGRLPNQDLINSFRRISLYTGGIPVILRDRIDVPAIFDRVQSGFRLLLGEYLHVQEYLYHAMNIVYQLAYQARGRPNGVHGLFHQYRIDAFTIFAVPADGPHGFHAIGRVMESTLRTTNNLLERLHASFFFYVLSTVDRFIKIGGYLPCVIFISTAMIIVGLSEWTNATSHFRSKERIRPMIPALEVFGILLITHSFGAILFTSIVESRLARPQLVLFVTIAASGFLPVLVLNLLRRSMNLNQLARLLKAINLCLASAMISVLSVLNFALAVWLAILLGVPLSISSPGGSSLFRKTRYIGYMILALGWLFFPQAVQRAVSDWEMLSVWLAPFVCVIYVPLVLQAGIVCSLP